MFKFVLSLLGVYDEESEPPGGEEEKPPSMPEKLLEQLHGNEAADDCSRSGRYDIGRVCGLFAWRRKIRLGTTGYWCGYCADFD